jgi:hypothetical protein
MMLIHVTLENGRTLLFEPEQQVVVCDWVSDNGEYFSGAYHVQADAIHSGVYVIEWIDGNACVIDGCLAKVQTVRVIEDEVEAAT